MDEAASDIVDTKIRINLRNLKKLSSYHTFSDGARQPCTLLKKSVLGLHLYCPAPWGAVDQWPLKM